MLLVQVFSETELSGHHMHPSCCSHRFMCCACACLRRATTPLRLQQCSRCRPAAAARFPNNSFDAEDDLDTDLAEELSKFKSPDAWNKVAKHLDLVWQVTRVRMSLVWLQHLLRAASLQALDIERGGCNNTLALGTTCTINSFCGAQVAWYWLMP